MLLILSCVFVSSVSVSIVSLSLLLLEPQMCCFFLLYINKTGIETKLDSHIAHFSVLPDFAV